MEAGYGGRWATGDTGEGMVTMVVGLIFEHLMPEILHYVQLGNQGVTIKLLVWALQQ